MVALARMASTSANHPRTTTLEGEGQAGIKVEKGDARAVGLGFTGAVLEGGGGLHQMVLGGHQASRERSGGIELKGWAALVVEVRSLGRKLSVDLVAKEF